MLKYNNHEKIVVDTINMRIYSQDNDDIKYIITMVDVFFRYAYAQSASKKGAILLQ